MQHFRDNMFTLVLKNKYESITQNSIIALHPVYSFNETYETTKARTK